MEKDSKSWAGLVCLSLSFFVYVCVCNGSVKKQTEKKRSSQSFEMLLRSRVTAMLISATKLSISSSEKKI